MDRPCLGGPEADEDGVGIGRHDKEIGVQFACQQFGTQILVHDSFDPDQLALSLWVIHGRNTTAAGTNDNCAVIEQPPNGADLE